MGKTHRDAVAGLAVCARKTARKVYSVARVIDAGRVYLAACTRSPSAELRVRIRKKQLRAADLEIVDRVLSRL